MATVFFTRETLSLIFSFPVGIIVDRVFHSDPDAHQASMAAMGTTNSPILPP